MPVIYIILLTFLLTTLFNLVTFLLIYVIMTGNNQHKVNSDLYTRYSLTTDLIKDIQTNLPTYIDKEGRIE
jgi:hypothetical protein